MQFVKILEVQLNSKMFGSDILQEKINGFLKDSILK
jgi:hypothetical protein